MLFPWGLPVHRRIIFESLVDFRNRIQARQTPGGMMILEQLGRDTEGGVSSQPTIRSGKNRGKRKPEVDGKWIYTGGYTHDSRWDEKNAHGSWLGFMTKIGFRTGKYELDGVVNLFVWVKNESMVCQRKPSPQRIRIEEEGEGKQ